VVKHSALIPIHDGNSNEQHDSTSTVIPTNKLIPFLLPRPSKNFQELCAQQIAPSTFNKLLESLLDGFPGSSLCVGTGGTNKIISFNWSILLQERDVSS
jgi:hypothetical protein